MYHLPEILSVSPWKCYDTFRCICVHRGTKFNSIRFVRLNNGHRRAVAFRRLQSGIHDAINCAPCSSGLIKYFLVVF